MNNSKILQRAKTKLENINLLEYKSFPIRAKELEKYNILYPKAAKIILQDFERVSINKIEQQKKSLEAQISMDRLSQWQGFIVSLVMIISAVVCGFFGKELVATTLIGVSALGLVKAIFPYKNKIKK